MSVAPNLASALAAFQANVPPITRSKTVTVRTKTGGSYDFSYAPYEAIIEAISEPLKDQGLAHSTMLSSIDGKPSIRTLLLHQAGERLEAEFPLPSTEGKTAQEIGSLISYMRRYALVSVLGLATDEDDDANVADGNTVTKQEKPKAEPTVNAATLKLCIDLAKSLSLDWDEEAQAVYGKAGADLTVAEAKGLYDDLAQQTKAAK